MENIEEIITKEVSPDTLPAALEIRNGIFPDITMDDWNRGGKKTGSIAFSGDQAVGFIPLFFREIKIAPGVTITGVFENAVGTKEEYRGKGIGHKMVQAASQFLKGKADVLFVYRGGERSRGYHFYEKTGHVDLLYTRMHTCDLSFAGEDPNVKISQEKAEIIKNEEYLLQAFEDTYHEHSGYWQREKGYWEKALNSPYYASRPANFYLFTLMKNHEITAYMIASTQKNPIRKYTTNKLDILEMAAREGHSAKMEIVLKSASSFARKQGLGGLALIAGDDHPFMPLLRSLKFQPRPRGTQVMGLIPDPKALFNKIWADRFHLPDIELNVWTPENDFNLLHSSTSNDKVRKVTLEMKQDTLIKWLMGRIDFKSRVREGTITIVNGSEPMIDAIAEGILHHKWAYHHIDFC